MEIRPGTIYGLSPSAVLRPVWVSWGCSLDSKLILVAVGCARASRKEGTGASPPLPGTRKGLLRLQTQTAHWLCEVGWASGWAHGMPQRPRATGSPGQLNNCHLARQPLLGLNSTFPLCCQWVYSGHRALCGCTHLTLGSQEIPRQPGIAERGDCTCQGISSCGGRASPCRPRACGQLLQGDRPSQIKA